MKMPVKLNEGEMREAEWWCRHHKDNVAYLCVVLRRIMRAHEENDAEDMAVNIRMMQAQLPAFEEISRS
tara:strand:- start:2550 stop:2756 length:207 start_codon:yes stop_codon:yes gene_type:complete